MVTGSPYPTLYESDKAVPLGYDTTVYINGQKQECKPSTCQGPAVTNIAGTEGLTRSGQIYGPEQQNKDKLVAKDKGKVVAETSQEQEIPSKSVID